MNAFFQKKILDPVRRGRKKKREREGGEALSSLHLWLCT